MTIHDYADGDQGFIAWLTLADRAIRARLGVGLLDLGEDYPLRDAYDDGEHPIEIAIEMALEQGCEG